MSWQIPEYLTSRALPHQSVFDRASHYGYRQPTQRERLAKALRGELVTDPYERGELGES